MDADRLVAHEVVPEAMEKVRELDRFIGRCGLERRLVELVKMRASQINGCAFCLDRHSRDARHAGETERRLYLLDGWAESTLFSARERAALAWTDALTRVTESHAPDAAYAGLRAEFEDAEIVNLTILVGLINLLNRLAIGLRYRHPAEAAA